MFAGNSWNLSLAIRKQHRLGVFENMGLRILSDLKGTSKRKEERQLMHSSKI
jgi:hypothetical protein